jgi:hypothetical protein
VRSSSSPSFPSHNIDFNMTVTIPPPTYQIPRNSSLHIGRLYITVSEAHQFRLGNAHELLWGCFGIPFLGSSLPSSSVSASNRNMGATMEKERGEMTQAIIFFFNIYFNFTCQDSRPCWKIRMSSSHLGLDFCGWC